MPPTAQSARKSQASQDFVPVKEVRNGVMLLKDGTLASVLLASSTNFALKSEDEQMATLGTFQSFLNSLDFSIQIFIESRRLDIRPYLALLDERFQAQTEDLMKIQVKEYIQFIKDFTERVNVMSKNFFVIVPYTPPMVSVQNAVGAGLLTIGTSSNSSTTQEKRVGFEEHRTQLEQRASVVVQGLARCGIRSITLGTEEVIELLYKMFNPGELEKPMKLDAQQA